MRTDGRTLAFALVAVVLGAVFLRLGFWQVDRLSERRAANEERAARLALPPVRLPPDAAPGAASAMPPADSVFWRRAVLQGRWDFDNELLVRNRSLHGVPGVHVATPLLPGEEEAGTGGPAAEGQARAILVRRGWLPAPDGLRADLAEGRPPAVGDRTGAAADPETGNGGRTAIVEGIVLPPEPGVGEEEPPRYRLDGGEHAALVRLEPGAVAAALPYPVEGFVIHATDPGLAGPALRLLPPPELDEGSHLLYAIQWFSFAAIAFLGAFFWLRHER